MKFNDDDVKACTTFIKERIKQSFLQHEKEAFTKGLKFLGISIGKYVSMQLNVFESESTDLETPPELDILNLPQHPLVRKIENKAKNISKNNEKIMDDFAIVQLSFTFIMLECLRKEVNSEAGLNYAQHVLKNFNKLIARLGGEKPPSYLTRFISNLKVEIKSLEKEYEEKKDVANSTDLVKDEDKLHYLQATANSNSQQKLAKTVHKIHFEDFGGAEFERLTLAFVIRSKQWDKTPEWIGQVGGDGGRDIWAIYDRKTFCYLCANHQKLGFPKGKSDIDKLVKNKTIPDNLILVGGGSISAKQRAKIIDYAKKKGIENSEVITGVEYEEKLRSEAPELIRRFFEGESFPDSPEELIKFNETISTKTDSDIVDILAECFDRPAFTTPFYRESSIPNFEKALDDTIEVLNTGVHRLRDGTIIRTVSSRHKIVNKDLKLQMNLITQLVIGLRDKFTELKRKKEIQPCSCDEIDCPVFMMSDDACKIMDSLRMSVFSEFKKVKADFNLKLN